jgi:ligand-binding sensor domain-containing protein
MRSMTGSVLRGLFVSTIVLSFLSPFLYAQTVKPFEEQFPTLQRIDHLERYKTEQGLSSNNCDYGLMVDRQGFLWIPTRNGLSRFDGHEFRVFRHDSRDSNSISTDYPRLMLEDRSGIIWIGSARDGLNSFDRKTNHFFRYYSNWTDSTTISDNRISAIFEDKAGTIWIGTERGLNKLIRQQSERSGERGSFVRYLHNPRNPKSIAKDEVWWRSIREDSSGALWVSLDGGVDKLDPATGEFTHYFGDPRIPATFGSRRVNQGYEDRSGVLWISTNDGLFVYDRKTRLITHIVHDPVDLTTLTNDLVDGVYEDTHGTIWAMTQSGLNEIDNKLGVVRRHQHNSTNPTSPSSTVGKEKC